MILNGFQPEQLALEWANRVAERMTELSLPDIEIEETRQMVFSFTKTAAQELEREPVLQMPHTGQTIELEAAHAHQVIDLLLRGIVGVSQQLRATDMDWEQRKRILEVMAWKLFNLAKLLIGFRYISVPGMEKLVENEQDLHTMMKQSANVLLQQELTGEPAENLSLPDMPEG